MVEKCAVVTGAGSGIGAAIARALTAAGADVVHADIDGDAAARVAGSGRSAQLDVTDPAAVQQLVDDVVERAGHLDLMFNNAGIGVGGDAETISLADWSRVIDVNMRGVVHGVEAADRGVRVSVVSSGFVETPMLNAVDAVGTFDVRRYLTTDQGVKEPMSPDALATMVLEGVRRNRAVIVAPSQARVAWRLARLSPRAMAGLGRRAVARQRRGP
jgi:NAD(P)-dependent dehydrogenase (short-subunit alcohol dehydrogenase family)